MSPRHLLDGKNEIAMLGVNDVSFGTRIKLFLLLKAQVTIGRRKRSLRKRISLNRMRRASGS